MLDFARAGAAVGATSATLEKTRILGAYFRTLEAIRNARGNAKAAPLEAMVRRMDAESARFFIKIISGEMRIGLSEGLVEAAIADAFGVPITQVKRVHLVTGDIGETAVRCKRGEFEASTITLFQPVRFMLASPVETPGEAFERMGAGTVWTEEKYDGVRCQLHRQASRVELFSRDLKETTGAFPELVENAPAIGHDVLFDGEVLAHRDGRVLRFFELQRRLGRKKVDVA